jgi:hypothetical protein
MDVVKNINANSAMVGKNRNSILTILRLDHVFMEIVVKNLIVHTTIRKQIKSKHYHLGSNTFLKPEILASQLIFMCPFLGI